ncbi:MAG: STAS domain-containing protein [Planctomycetota bacterium]
MSVTYVTIKKEQEIWHIYFNKNMYFELKDINGAWVEIYEGLQNMENIKVVLNFELVDTFSSLFIGKLVAFQKKISSNKGHLVLCNIKSRLLELFEVTKINKIFSISPTLTDAYGVLKKH